MPATAAFTPEQELALRRRDTSIALAAGAGCGKTFVLTERFLSHLERDQYEQLQPAELHQLIAITFTDAAAREMRRRIREKCYERLQSAATPADQDYWLQLMRAIEAARVSTIHAFCASLLRTHAVAAGLDPGFGVLEQGEADVLTSQVIDDVLRDRLAALDAPTMQLAAVSGLSRLKTHLRELLKYRHENAFEAWSEKSPAEIVAAWQTCFDTEALPAAMRDLAESSCVAQVVDILENTTPPAGNDKFADARGALLDLLPQLDSGKASPAALERIRESAKVQGICAAKDWPSKAAFDDYKEACSELRKAIDKCLELNFDADGALQAAEIGLGTLQLAREVAAAFERRKSQQNKLDFDDLLALAHRLLTHPENAALQKELSQDLRLLLVDEFQDTDSLQVELVKALCGDGLGDGKLFLVGDFKQSIYRFRGAQPEVFHRLRDEIREPGKLPLTLNFRSQPAILNFVNALFGSAFGDRYEPLRPHRPQLTAEPAVEFLWTIDPDKNNRRIPGSMRKAREVEARRIAQRLWGLVESEEPIIADDRAPGGKRKLELGDIAILFRALSDVDAYESALRDYGLDYYLVGGHAFYSQQEIYDVLNLLRAVASPADEIALAGVLRSPMFSLADETLFWLVETAGSLNAGLFGERLPSELAPAERAKALAAASTLAHLRAVKDNIGIAPLLESALARTAYDAALLGEFLGERKLANLNKLLEQARAADRGGTLDLAGFIAQLGELIAREPKEALAATLSESADVIRLMTIHQAKGLEFPLVVIPDLDRGEIDRVPDAVLDASLGPLVSLPSDELPDDATTGLDLFRIRERQADAEERKRLLYVATTRAGDYLILSSSLAGYDANQRQSDWTKLLGSQFELSTGALTATLPAGYATPQVRVLDGDLTTVYTPSGRRRGPDLVQLLNDARAQAEAGGSAAPHDVAPIGVDAAARRQFSVSRLTGRLVRDEERRAVLVQEKFRRDSSDVDPLALGVLVHAALERLNPRAVPAIGPWCEQLADELVLNKSARTTSLAAEMVASFVQSPRWAEIAAAKQVHREIEFLLPWPANEGRQSGVYLRGYIDLLYQDGAGGWHIVDYKTNNIASGEVKGAAAQYEMQMAVYALAVEQSLGVAPADATLCFLRPGAEHTTPWTDAKRAHATTLVNEALGGNDE
jgi:ATP-dependent helicase/nuclease subunit A